MFACARAIVRGWAGGRVAAVAPQGPLRTKFRSDCEHFEPIGAMSDEAAALHINDLGARARACARVCALLPRGRSRNA
jgi:hypothetical protein